MSQKDKYGLVFYSKVINGTKRNMCDQKIPAYNENSHLTFLNFIDIGDCRVFINQLTGCLNSQGNVDEGFFSDSIDDRNIIYQYPYVVIDNILTIPMSDLKELLEEWLQFIS